MTDVERRDSLQSLAEHSDDGFSTGFPLDGRRATDSHNVVVEIRYTAALYPGCYDRTKLVAKSVEGLTLVKFISTQNRVDCIGDPQFHMRYSFATLDDYARRQNDFSSGILTRYSSSTSDYYGQSRNYFSVGILTQYSSSTLDDYGRRRNDFSAGILTRYSSSMLDNHE